MKKYKMLVLIGCCMLQWGSAFCADGNNPWTHSFHFENDLFNGTDSNYTNGVKYTMISPDITPYTRDGKLPRYLLELAHKIPFIHEPTPRYSHKVEFSLGQNMYTPGDIERKELIKDDRPYAGWTYFSTAYHRKYNEDKNIGFMDTVEIQLGLVGPESYAEESQKFVHEIRDFTKPNGWDHQLKNEIGLAVAFERKWLLHIPEQETLGYSVTSHLGATLGNVYTYLNSGLELRLGWGIPKDFGVSIIRPAGSTRLEIAKGFTIYFFGAVNGKLIARNIFLDGNTFTDSHSIDKNFLVADIAGGLAIGYKRLIITWTEVLRTKQFKGQDDEHSFGSVALSFSFPFDFE